MNPVDPTRELRERVVSLTYRYPKGAFVQRYPFAMLQGLTDASRRSILGDMDYPKLSELFDLAPQCACPGDPKLRAQSTHSLPPTPRLPEGFA